MQMSRSKSYQELIKIRFHLVNIVNYSIHQNHLEGLLKQIVGSYPEFPIQQASCKAGDADTSGPRTAH